MREREKSGIVRLVITCVSLCEQKCYKRDHIDATNNVSLPDNRTRFVNLHKQATAVAAVVSFCRRSNKLHR